MVNYQEGKIYIIRSYLTDDVYIGSTCQSLSTRLSKHKGYLREFLKNGRLAPTSRHIVKYDDCYIELLELYKCTCRAELFTREGHFIRSMKCVNKNNPTPQTKEMIAEISKIYNKNNSKRLKNQHAKYYENNKEKWTDKQKERYECECGVIVYINDKTHHEKTQKHLIIMEKDIITIICECGSIIGVNDQLIHEKTQKHLDFIGQEIMTFNCECGSQLSSQNKLNRHLKSKKLLDFINPPPLKVGQSKCDCGLIALTRSLKDKKHINSKRHQAFLKQLESVE